MPVSAPAQLPVVRLHLLCRAEAALQLPAYAGSMLRGAFGHALKALALLPHEDRRPCALHTRCAYCQVFAPPPLPNHSLQKFSQMPAPYVIEPPGASQRRQLAGGDTFQFSLVLIGHALQHLPAIVLAFERGLRRGLTRRNICCTLLSITTEGEREPIWQAGQSAPIVNLPTGLPPAAQLHGRATLHFHTPLRLQYQNKPARQHELNARTLLVALARRHQLLLDGWLGAQAPQHDFTTLAQLAQTIRADARSLRWLDWERYSNRQQQNMKLGGLVGPLHLQGELAPFGPLLHLGQWLHCGKETVFGLGGYRLQAIPAVTA